MTPKILAIDDDRVFLNSLQKMLAFKEYNVDVLSNSNKVVDQIVAKDYDLVLMDVKMPGKSGIELFSAINSHKPTLPVIMISGQSNIQIAVDLIKKGAFDFIEKPLEYEKLFISINNALTRKSLIQEKTVLFEELEENFRMVGVSPQLTKIVNTIKTIAETKAKVLITGESGTGKELIAWAVHHNSKRSGKPYIKLNCASIPEELLESELFGHKKGSFTGAYNNYKGKFIAADGGTLFLDEIGDMSINLQSKLLRVLEDEEVQAVGESASVKIDVRIVAATNKNLEVEILNGKFREDLYHRLNVVKIEVPPLRERKEDILPISYLFLKKYTDIYNKKISSFSPKTEAYLNNNPWRGNVRELRNFIEKCVLFAKRNEIGFDVVSEIISTKFDAKEEVNNENLRIAKNKFEREHIISVLNKHNWKVLETATALGIDRAHLFKKMKQLSIEK